MLKPTFENELISNMQQELHKQASSSAPDLVKAAECLHAALEIFEEQGLHARADQILELLSKIAQTHKTRNVEKMPSLQSLMEAGLTQRDMHEFSKGNPLARAKFNLVLRSLGLADHQIAKFLGPTNVMSEEDAKAVLDPGSSYGKIHEWLKDPSILADPNNPGKGEAFEFSSIAQKKSSSRSDKHTKGLTSKKMVENIKSHGHPLNLADSAFAMDIPLPSKKEVLEADIAYILDASPFDIDASDDELMGLEIKDDSLEVFDAETSMEDFEDERD